MMDFSQNSLFQLPDDLQEISIIERPVRRSFKTPEEIERLTVDEKLNDIERAVYLLSCGQDVQGMSVVVSLPNLVRQNPTETLRRVVPKVREFLHLAGVEVQLAAAFSFLSILQEESVSIHSYTHSFLQIILQNLDHRDTGVSNAWLETLLAVVDALPKEAIRQEILNPIVSKAQLSQSLQSRLANCKILGKVAKKFEVSVIKKDMLPLVKSLCQDVEYEVRSCMCRQLEHIAHGIGPELTKATILPELIELARDESSSVRLAAFDTTVNLLELFDKDDRSQTLFPQVKLFCEKSFKSDETVLASLSLQLGKLCHHLSGCFTPEQHLWFLELYKRLSTLGLHHENGHSEQQIPIQSLELEKKIALVRKNCAYNIPAMVLFVEPQNFQLELYSTFSSLCNDPAILVRKTAALGFHEVAKLLSPNIHLIHKELVALLQDNSLEVLDTLLDYLPETLELMTTGGDSAGSDTKLVNIPDLIPALTAAEQKAALSLKWRVHEKMLQKYSCLPHVISSDQIYYRFLHRMFTIIINNNVLPVQRAAAKTLCIFLRHNRKQEQRQEIINKLIDQLGRGKSYWNRLRFLDTCEFVMELFSKSFFCKYFFLSVLELVNDPVANVRIKLCYMLPKLKASLKLPTDRNLLQQLELCVRKLLCQEKDKDVTAIIRKVVFELDKMEIAVEPFQKRCYEKDLLDLKKEKEEILLLEMEQMEKEKQQNEMKSSSEKLADKKRRDSKAGSAGIKTVTTSNTSNRASSPSGKEGKKTKMSRSRSLSNHTTPPKLGALDKSIVKGSATGSNSSVPGTGKSALLPLSEKPENQTLRSSSRKGNKPKVASGIL
nr:PREDICTED: serine/threonine-protein phosphatase 4 regulatory subunit 4 isoform X2 [Latimeria chalumnae]|eukprot:XP_014352688.1 PREDICTED: serine/threonine-protein phosphatase 4 regulatory subunit 4 isoform X2 [Latimeria chalumnae]